MSKSKYSTCALVVIDLQKDFFDSSPGLLESQPNLPRNTIKLFDICRSNSIELIHIRAVYNKNDSKWFPYYSKLKSLPVDNIEQVSSEAAGEWASAMENEKIIIKHTFDAFYNTELEEYLKSRGIQTLLLCGVVTSVCVLMSLHGAFARGFQTLIVKDCTADKTKLRQEHFMSTFGFMFKATASDTLLQDLDQVLAPLQDTP
jgi:nicotinamidase-related amidase